VIFFLYLALSIYKADRDLDVSWFKDTKNAMISDVFFANGIKIIKKIVRHSTIKKVLSIDKWQIASRIICIWLYAK